jgi:hypothetical protein
VVCAVGLLLAESLYGLKVIQRSRKRSGFDYWVCETAERLFQDGVRLEVTGILSGDSAAILARQEQKLERLRRYPSHLRALVAVIEFGSPQARLQTQ